ncbi:protein of unknown function [Latilactobacillus sakei]|nr:protein of unknown function [Latilactobacillus sakei]
MTTLTQMTYSNHINSVLLIRSGMTYYLFTHIDCVELVGLFIAVQKRGE